MRAIIETVEEMRLIDDQPYESVGDYYKTENGDVHFDVLDTGSEFTNSLIALHEFGERLLNQRLGVTDGMVDEHDLKYADHNGEPGDLPDSPYRDQHALMVCFEYLCCVLAGVSWTEHDGNVQRAYYKHFGKFIEGGSLNPQIHFTMFRELLKKAGII